jgi:uncharacterized protein YeaO (DUF488 family)
MIEIKRLYDQEVSGKHYSILVDRFWPRGFSKKNVKWNEWMREIAPSRELIKWFGHDPEKWTEFKSRYQLELAKKPEELHKIKELEMKHGSLTLLYSARDEKHNNAVVLKEIVNK